MVGTNIESSVFVKTQRRRIDDVGFSDEKIDFESIFHFGERIFIDFGEESCRQKNGENKKERFHLDKRLLE